MLSTIQASLQDFITSGAAALWLRLRIRDTGVRKLQGVPDKKLGFLGWEGAVGHNNVLISAMCVHCVLTVTTPLDLVGSFWVEMRAVSTEILPNAIV
jgi:hypothetical protein